MKLARYISVTCLKFKRFRTVDKLEYRCGLVEWFSIDNRGTLWDISNLHKTTGLNVFKRNWNKKHLC